MRQVFTKRSPGEKTALAPTVTLPTKLALVHRIEIGASVGGKGVAAGKNVGTPGNGDVGVAAGVVGMNVGTAGKKDVGMGVDSGGCEIVDVGLAASSVSWATAVPPAARVSSAAMVWAAAVKMASRASAVGVGATGTQALVNPMTQIKNTPVPIIRLFMVSAAHAP
jgi:hypothetical protein